MQQPPSVVIVGAGISGLSLAFRLQQTSPQLNITVLEQANYLGGCMRTLAIDGFRVETGPNGFLDNKPSTRQLCGDLGLEQRLIAASETSARHRYLFLNNRLMALPNNLRSFLSSKLLTWWGKLSLLAEPFRSRRYEISEESIDAFVRRRAGSQAADILADALVTGIHAGDPKLLSVQAAFPRLVELERQYGSLVKGLGTTARQRRQEAKARGEVYQRPRMWSFAEGMGLVIDSLRSQLKSLPMTGICVKRVEKADEGWTTHAEGQDKWPAKAVVLTCPAYRQAEILADLDPELAERIGAVAYNRIAVVALGYRRADVPHSLDGFGYIAPQHTRRDLLGVQWCSSIFPARAPDGMVLMRALCGGWHRPEIVDWDDARLYGAIAAELRLALGITAEPCFRTIIRWDRAIPQYHLGHLERVAWIEDRLKRHPGLYLGGNAYHGIAINDCTEQANVLARRLHGGGQEVV